MTECDRCGMLHAPPGYCGCDSESLLDERDALRAQLEIATELLGKITVLATPEGLATWNEAWDLFGEIESVSTAALDRPTKEGSK